jgi:hypothetical protein
MLIRTTRLFYCQLVLNCLPFKVERKERKKFLADKSKLLGKKLVDEQDEEDAYLDGYPDSDDENSKSKNMQEYDRHGSKGKKL